MIAVPPSASAGTAGNVRRIGVLNGGKQPSAAELQEEYGALRPLGWTVGQNLLVERRYANGRAELLGPFARELVQLKVEIIQTAGTDATVAARNATTTIPIVIESSGDPVRAGLVASLARPGGNVTGFSIVGPEIDAKRLALLRELLPSLQRIGVLENSTNPYYRAVHTEFEQTCRSLGMWPIFVEVASGGELENALAEMSRRGAQALFVNRESLFVDNRVALISAAGRFALPILASNKEMLQAGALVYYANSDEEQDQRVAAFIDRILRGAKPANLPIEQPTKFELGINLKVAKALRITIPQSLLLRADRVID